MNVMAHMVNEILTVNSKGSTATEELTEESFQRWDQGYIFDAICNQRYGQAFCNYFGIHDNVLFYTRDIERCKQLIKKLYLA